MPDVLSRRPLITANFALTWDGRISTRNRTPSDFSSPEDKRRFLAIRALADAILVTPRTAAADGMSMTIPPGPLRAERRARGQKPNPLRVLVSNSGRLPLDLPLLTKPGGRIYLFTAARRPPQLPGVETVSHESETVRLPALATHLHTLGVRRLHCEGGGELFRSLCAEKLIDELYLTLCPRVFGGQQAPTLTGVAGDFLPQSLRWKTLKREVIDGECYLHLRRLR